MVGRIFVWLKKAATTATVFDSDFFEEIGYPRDIILLGSNVSSPLM
jgi:hypothetical protein